MEKTFSLIFLAFLLIFTGCSGISNTKSGPVEKLISGKGLEVDFDIDDEYISSGKLRYEITLENSGELPVVLKRENFILSYSPDDEIITSDSIESFYNKVFDGNSKIEIYSGQEFSTAGVLNIKNNFLTDTILSEFKIRLSINYDYSTQFSNNILIDTTYKKGSELFDITDKLSQAAPIVIDDIEMIPELEEGEFELIYYFDNNGYAGDMDNVYVEIKNVDMGIGTNSISCNPRIKDGDNFREVSKYFISSDMEGELIALCPVSLNSNDIYNTITFGSFDYNYEMEFSEVISLPEK